ncbi:MAG: HAD-IIA family hydrolase [Anaerolineaceae bacterium]|nr:HAD-IIA family hydrolase [Anaerolineaceae bacterium]
MNLDVLKNVKTFLLDLDGTLYLGDQLFDWTPGFLETLRELGLQRIFMTNNSSRDAASYAEKLGRLGIEAEPREIITSGQSAALYLREQTDIRTVYVLGTESLAGEVRQAGKTVVAEGADALLVGYATNLDFAGLSQAAIELQRGARFLATHPDRSCPDPRGMLPDCGAMCACLTSATGRKVEHVFGKPSSWMLRLATERAGLEVRQMVLVGDRLYTDIQMAVASGMPSVLVLSGETGRDGLSRSEVRPDLVFEDVGALGKALEGS